MKNENRPDLKSSLNKMYENEKVEPNQEILDNLILKMKTIPDKKPKQHLTPIKKVILAIVCLIVIIIPSVLIPVLLIDNTPEEETYYCDEDLIEDQLTLEEARTLVLSKNSNYGFLFDECNFNQSSAFYNDKNELITISLKLEKNDFPFTIFEIVLVYYNNYEFKYHDDYTNLAEVKQISGLTVYEKTSNDNFDPIYYRYIIHKNHKVYLLLDKEDTDIINKFIEN